MGRSIRAARGIFGSFPQAGLAMRCSPAHAGRQACWSQQARPHIVAGYAGWSFLGSRILYQATYSAGRNSRVSNVAMMIPPIIA